MDGSLDGFAAAVSSEMKNLIYPAYHCQSEKIKAQIKKVWRSDICCGDTG
jgi:hypothetical protein